jgi:hypothetical protein
MGAEMASAGPFEPDPGHAGEGTRFGPKRLFSRPGFLHNAAFERPALPEDGHERTRQIKEI